MSIPIPFPKLKRSLWQLLGPSVVFVAVSLNGGELLLWPSLAANFSLKILWAIPIILVLQFVINLEIERYSLVTGKSTEEHLVGSVKWLAALFAFSVIISLVWPAWMSTAGNLLAVVFLPETATEGLSRNVGLVITAVLLLLTAVVFKARKTYKLIETISKYGLMVALGIILLTVALNFDAEIFLEGLRGLVSWGYIPEEMPRFDFLAALAFGGVAGVLNLAQSEWVIDKKYGVAGVAEKDRGNVEFESAQSRKHFKEWFRTVNTEHFLLFFCANLFSIFLLAYLGRLLLPLGSAQGFGVLVAEIATLNGQMPYLGVLFAISGILIFIMANIAILDAIGRLMHRMLKPLRKNKKVMSANDISVLSILVGVVILILSLLIPSFKQPFTLLVISASLSAIVMWMYPPLLLKLNLQLPKPVRPRALRVVLLLVCTGFYGAASLWALATILPLWIIGVIGGTVTGYQLYFLLRKRVA